MAEVAKRYAVVTGANKGLGFEICKQLASNGITVVLTARDEKRGLEAVDKLKQLGLPGHVVFHQLDVNDPASIVSFEDFIRTQYGKLDILVNNAAIMAGNYDRAAFEASVAAGEKGNWTRFMTPTDESVAAAIRTNYYGVKGMCEALIPLLKSSDSARIVNVSTTLGCLQFISNGWAKGVLSDVESLTEEKVDEVLNQFLEDFKEGLVETKGWPTFLPGYSVTKAALNAYTRILAKKYPTLYINAVTPGFVKTDINYNNGLLSVEEGAQSVVKLALLPNGGPSGLFFSRSEVAPF
ncbi:(+)-neomenthol dehydrogenase-like [Gastrolobium bilobum]|uniref:(+)-neomenthol dehydrogenase-like n=1 Tax=Gastrolobium bilobum TaxID=150636 RepID=UPI002AB118CB|nr:(+)-neomenthol dehydrogenase-like [Gastrolobium bilobum]